MIRIDIDQALADQILEQARQKFPDKPFKRLFGFAVEAHLYRYFGMEYNFDQYSPDYDIIIDGQKYDIKTGYEFDKMLLGNVFNIFRWDWHLEVPCLLVGVDHRYEHLYVVGTVDKHDLQTHGRRIYAKDNIAKQITQNDTIIKEINP